MSSATDHVVTVTRVIHAPPERIFALLADPARHVEIDGSGSVRKVRTAPAARPLQVGDRFTMGMRIVAPYVMRNTVVECEPDRRIAWRQDAGRHVWRYELEPVDGGTLVRETFDARPSRTPWLLRLMKAHERNRASMVQTLDRLAAAVEGP